MAFVNYNLACPSCNSSDAFAIDDAGWGTCFSCSTRIPPEGDSRDTPEHKRTSDTEPLDASQALFTTDLSDRKLTKDTCVRYGVGWNNGDLYFPIGEAAKVRINGEKQFKIIGNFQADKRLFGQERFTAGQKYIIVTEGEFDAMAAYQMMQGKTPCVSVRNGAQSAYKDCKENYDWLDSFESIVFAFDSDAQGIEAQKKCCELFAHKAKYMKHPEGIKDANDYLVKNKSADFVQGFWRAEVYVPDGIVSAGDFLEALLTPIPKAPIQYPFDGLNKMLYGIRPAELVTLCAGSGLGKSTILREFVMHILKETDEKLGLAFFEETPERTLRGLVGLEINKPIHMPECEYDPQEVIDVYAQYDFKERVMIWNHFGSNEIDTVVNRMRAFVKSKGCKYLIVDHLSMIVSDQSNGDERKAIDEVMSKFRKFVQETEVSMLLVSHLKRPDGKSLEDGAATSLGMLRGSASIAQLSDAVISAERNSQADDMVERNTTKIRVLKSRLTGKTGPACRLFYNEHTGRLTEVDEEDL